jgi:hypothetical protein
VADTQKPSFEVNGRAYEFPESLSMGEMCDAELYFGVEFGSKRTSGIRMVAAMLWVAISRVDSTVTVEDIRALPAEVFETFANLEDDAGPPVEQLGSNGSSGGGSSDSGVVLDEIPVATGDPISLTGVTSESTTSQP